MTSKGVQSRRSSSNFFQLLLILVFTILHIILMVLLKSLTPLTSHVLLSYLVLGHCTNPLLLLLQGHFSIELGNLLNRIRRLSYLDLHLRAVILLGSSFVEALNILLLWNCQNFSSWTALSFLFTSFCILLAISFRASPCSYWPLPYSLVAWARLYYTSALCILLAVWFCVASTAAHSSWLPARSFGYHLESGELFC